MVNFDRCNDNLFKADGMNEFFLKLVEEGKSSKGDDMWVCHFVPVAKKDEKGREGKWTFFPYEITVYVTFDEKGKIKNSIDIMNWCEVLSRKGETHIGRILQNAMGNPDVSCFVDCALQDREYNGKTYYDAVPVSFWKTRPTPEDAKKKMDAYESKQAMTKGIQAQINAANDDDDDDMLPY